MQLSATELGKEYGLSGEEMNRVLVKLGYLMGDPGDYDVTIKGSPYAVTKNFHRGTGGYGYYNRYWNTRTFDDSIKDVLEVTKELVSEVRAEIEEGKLLRAAARKAAREKANAEFLAKEGAKQAEKLKVKKELAEALKKKENWKTVGKVGLVASGILLTGYGVYKVTPYLKQWREKSKKVKEKETVETE